MPLYAAIGMKRRGLRRRASPTQTEYLTQDLDAVGADEAPPEEDFVWLAQRSSPLDLGLL